MFLIALAACGGILLAEAAGNRPGPWIAGCAAAGLLLRRLRRPGTAALLAAAVFGLIHTLHSRDPLRQEVHSILAPGEGMSAEVTGVVIDAPEPGFAGNWTLPLRAEAVHAHAPREPLPSTNELLYVRIQGTDTPPQYGDRVHLTGMLTRPDPVRNPGEFDFDSYLQRQGFAAMFLVTATESSIRVLQHNAGNPVMAAALRSREWIGRTVTSDLTDDPDIAATVRTMVLGTREKAPQDILDAFRASGTMHIFAVSGLHVGLFSLIVWSALRALHVPRGLMVAACLTLVFFYVFITGLRPSAWRAAIMLAMVMVAPALNRETALFSSLGTAALVLLGCNTLQLFQPGFSLSFGVLLAIAAFHGPLMHLTHRIYSGDPFLPRELHSPWQRADLWVRRRLCESLSVSAAATAGSLPLMIGYFRIVTPVGIVANLLLVLLSLWILVFACASLASGLAGLSWLTACWNNTNWALASLSIASAKFFASVPSGHIRVDPARLWRGSPCEVTVLALDHGGGAVHIDTPSGHHWLLDCGGRRHFARTVRPHLERTPVNRLTGLILSHSDSAHTGAAGEVAALFPPRYSYSGGGIRGGTPRLHTGDTLTLDAARAVSLRTLFPPPGWDASLADDRCLVAALECRGFRILFCFDAGFVTEKALLESGEDLRADVLVRNRHASDFSGLPEFLNAVAPSVIIYSNHRFPAAERVPEEWRAMAATKARFLFDQSQSGAVILRIDDRSLTARGYLDGREAEILRGGS